jgi:hypothetical protein
LSDPLDAAFLGRLRAGEEAAFETLVREFAGRVLAVTRRFLSHEEDAREALPENVSEDLVQAILAARRAGEGPAGA